jgi:hypothetical protein
MKNSNASPRDQQDPSVVGFTSNFESPNPSPLTALHHNHIHRMERVTFAVFPAVMRALLAAGRLAWTIWTYRALINERDNLTEADLRDLAIKPGEATSLAWKEARQRAAERGRPHPPGPPD